MAETINGFPGLTNCGSRTTFDPFRGVSQEVIWEGPQEACIAGYNSLNGTNAYRELDLTLKNPTGRLIVRTPDYSDDNGNNTISINWELVNSPGSRSGYEHPKITALDDATITRIKKALKSNSGKPSDLSGNASLLWDHMQHGQDSFFSSQCTFRIIQTISRGGQINVSFTNQHRVYSSSALIAETNPTSVYIAAINNAFSTYAFSTPTGFTKGWLKQPPSFNNVAGGRVSVTIEYYLDCWSDLYYTA